jgi:hypothetical protein
MVKGICGGRWSAGRASQRVTASEVSLIGLVYAVMGRSVDAVDVSTGRRSRRGVQPGDRPR